MQTPIAEVSPTAPLVTASRMAVNLGLTLVCFHDPRRGYRVAMVRPADAHLYRQTQEAASTNSASCPRS